MAKSIYERVRAAEGAVGRLTAIVPAAMLRKWDRLALPQLCEAIVKMDEELYWLQDCAQQADHYQALAQELSEQLGDIPHPSSGITQAGELSVVRQ